MAALVLCGCASRSVQPEHLDATSFGTAHALIIGNTNYDNHAPLASAREDSAMLAQLFTERCDLRVQLLQDATEAQILAELERLEELVEDDFVLLYFSGHGSGEKGGGGHWLPLDAAAKADPSEVDSEQTDH